MAALVSLSDVKTLYLDIAADDTSKDTAITAWIAWASAEIERYCNQPLITTTYTDERFDGTGTSTWVFPHTLPVSGIQDLEYITGFGGTWTAVGTDNYEVHTRRGVTLLYKPTGFTQGRQNYRVTYTTGYAQNAMPDAIKRVCCEMVARIYAESNIGSTELGRDTVNGTMEGIGIVNIKIIDNNTRWKRLLSNYRLPVV